MEQIFSRRNDGIFTTSYTTAVGKKFIRWANNSKINGWISHSVPSQVFLKWRQWHKRQFKILWASIYGWRRRWRGSIRTKSSVMWLGITPVAKTARPEEVQYQSYCNPAYCHQQKAVGTSLVVRQTTWQLLHTFIVHAVGLGLPQQRK